MTKVEKQEAIKKIARFFSRKRFSKDELRKIRRLAMSNSLKLGKLRQYYCKFCLTQLKGKIRIIKTKTGIHRIIECKKCGKKNRYILE